MAKEAKRVLIIEDLPWMLEELKCLKVDGFEVIDGPRVENAEEAIELVEKEKPDVVVLDLTLETGYDGLEVAQFILANFSEMLILSASGRSRSRQKEIYREEGIFGVKHFPGKSRELIERCLAGQCDCHQL